MKKIVYFFLIIAYIPDIKILKNIPLQLEKMQ